MKNSQWAKWAENPPTEDGCYWVYTKNRSGVHFTIRHRGKWDYSREFEYWIKLEKPKPPRK